MDAVDALLDEHAEGGYVFPAYEDYCFERVAPTALSVLDAAPDDTRTLPDDVLAGVDTDGIEHVVLVLVDGLGYDDWQAVSETAPLLSAVSRTGSVTPLTSVYPTETAAAITTLHTGVPPAEHGILGWFQYVESVPAVVQTLPWTTLDGKRVDEAYSDAPGWREALLDADTLYERVEDVETHVIQPKDIVGSASGDALSRGVDEQLGYDNVADAAVRLRHALDAAELRSYTLVYVPDVDAVAHRDGPGSETTRAQAENVCAALERELARVAPEVAEQTLLVLTADHGQVGTGGENIDIRGYEPIWSNLATGPDGGPIPPVGSSRNLQLHLEDGTVERVRAALERDFDCRTFTREEYEARGLFGGGDDERGATYARRAPGLLCVHREKGMWYEEGSLDHVGKHGGMTRAEMLVPFGAARLDGVRDELGEQVEH